MREIKFRALIKWQHFKWFVYWYYVYSNNSDTHQIIDEHGQIHYISPETLWQYIWRRDHNWVEIYEGDILRHPTRRYTFIWDVIYNYNTASFRMRLSDHENCLGINNTQKLSQDRGIYEIMGNIHQDVYIKRGQYRISTRGD